MTEADAGASFVEQKTENVFVYLDTAAKLTNLSSAYIERLCRDGYVPCAGGVDGELFPNIAELAKVLNVVIGADTKIDYVPAMLIATPSMSREQLLQKQTLPPLSVVGNQPVGMNIGGVSVPAPLKRGALSFALVSDEEEVSTAPQVASVVSAPPPPPPVAQPELETPPVPLKKALPLHWPVKTSSDAAQHFDDAPLMPPLMPKPTVLATPAPVAIIEEPNTLPVIEPELLPEVAPENTLALAKDMPLAGVAEEEVMVAPVDELALPPVQDLIVPPQEDLAVPPQQEMIAAPVEDLALPVEQELMEQGEMAVAAPAQEELLVAEEAYPAVSNNEEVALTPDQTLVQSKAQSIDIGPMETVAEGDEKPAIFPPSVEQVSTAADASWYTPKAEVFALEVNPSPVEEQLPLVQPEVVINRTPPVVEEGIADRILEEGRSSMVTRPALDEVVESREQEIVVPPIVAVPHYAVAQVTPSTHPLALPPRVVPFATSVPAAYPQVAAVFTQPHARASEWLPWMRTSHFSKTAVQVATNPELHPPYPRYHKSATADVSSMVSTPSLVVANPQQKVFVSVVGKPVPPVAVPIEKHVAPSVAVPSPASVRVVPLAADAWDEMLAPQTTRDSVSNPAFEEVPKKSREELLKEVAADIKDSWDASFLTGLGAA